MDSDLLPLMEDDSLIQDPNQTPSNPNSNSNSNSSLHYFNCSPFNLPPSNTKSGKDGVHMEKPSSSSSESSNNKENVNSSNVEVPKLGMGPMQMKKKKKGGGYNLRKSLAWDRAFFTDEGILDPLELTLITGINANTCGGGLPTISEEGNSSFSCDTQCTKGPKDKEISEEAVRKELHHDKSRTSKVNGQKTGCSAGNHDSSPHRKVTHKFPPIDRTNRAGSKVGVPGPLAASSLKRPANLNTLKAATKESKLPKLPMSKPGSLYSATTKGSTAANQPRHNLIPKPTMNAQKNVALKSSVKNVHGSQSKAKTGSSLRLPTKEPAKKTTNSSSKATSSTKSRLPQVDRANSGSEVVPDRFQLREIQEGSGPLAAKNQVHHISTSLNNSLPEAARPTSSGPCHIERASDDGLIISDRLHPSDNQEHAATLASSHNIGMYPPNTQPARPSGLRLPSPSLRFFDQRTALESGSLQQKKVQLDNTSLGSNRKISELRPPRGPPRTPMKINDISEQAHSTHCGSTPSSSPLPNYLRSASKGILDSDIYSYLKTKITQREDIKMQYDCRGSEVHKAIEQENRTIGHDGNTKTEKFPWNKDEEIKVGVENRQVMSGSNDEKVPLVPETKGRFVLHNEEDRLQNYSAITMSTFGQSIQHQEQIITTAVDGSTNFMHDRAQTSSEQADIEKSDASKANPESHLDDGSLKSEEQVSKVFAESHKDGIGKSEDDVGATKWVGPVPENCSVVLQHIKIGQENDVAKVVDELYKSSHMEDDAGCSADRPCTETNRRISIPSGESLKDEAGNGENTDTRELEGTVTMLDTSVIPFQDMDSEQGNDNADNVPVFPARPSVRDAGTLVLHDHSSAEGFDINPSTSIENKVQLQDSPVRDAVMMVQPDNRYVEGFHIDSSTFIETKVPLQDSGIANQSANCFETTIPCDSVILNTQFCSEGRSVNCILPAESSSLEEGQCDDLTEIDDLFFQEKGLKESVVQVGQCTSSHPQSLEKEGLNLAASATEAEVKVDDESQKSPEIRMIIGSLSKKSIEAEESQHTNMMEGSATIHGCTGGPETNNEFQSENTALEDSVTIDKFPKTHLQDAEMQLLDGDVLVQSCSSLTSVLENRSMQDVDHSDIFEEQPEFPDTGMRLEMDIISNHQLPPTTDRDLHECVRKEVTNVVDQHDVGECDRRPSNIIVHSPPVGQAAAQLCVEHGTSCSTAMDSSAEHDENYSDRHFTCNTECSDLALLSELKSSGKDEMEGLNTCMEYCSAGEESCSFLRKAADPILEEKPTLCDDDFVDIRQIAADDKQACMKESLSPEKDSNLEKPNNALDIIAVPEQSISHGCDRDLQNSNASALLPKVQGNVSGSNGEDQPNEPQGFHGIMPSQETCDYATNERAGYGLESSGQDPLESNSNVPLSQHITTCGEFTSTALCSVTEESCLVAEEEKSLRKSTYMIGAEESNPEEVETETLQEGKHSTVGEFHHELDSGSDLKHDKDATKKSNNIKKQDNSLAIHLPNAVPFSDEWLAAIEAAGEEILTMKHGAVQHSPPDKSLPEPSPWSPVKKKGIQIGPYDCTKYTNAMPSNPE